MWHCPSVFAFDSYNHLRPFYEELAFPIPETMDSFVSELNDSICSWEEDPEETMDEAEISFQDYSPPTCYPHASIFGPYSLNTSSGIFLSNPNLENQGDGLRKRLYVTPKVTKLIEKPEINEIVSVSKECQKGDTPTLTPPTTNPLQGENQKLHNTTPTTNSPLQEQQKTDSDPFKFKTPSNDFSVTTSSGKSEVSSSFDDESDKSFYSEDEVISEEMKDSPENFKLQSSKSPIMDALVFCALKGWGIKLLCDQGDDIKFHVTDLDEYYECSSRICAKQNPTEDHAARIKALKRWFPNFPTKRDVSGSFVITVHKGTKKDDKPKKLHKIIERQKQLLGKVRTLK